MKLFISRLALLASLTAFTSYAFADENPNGFYVWANVVDVTPIVSTETIRTPTSHCKLVREERRRVVRDRRDRRRDGVLPALFGSVIGGVIGNQFGSGNGKRAMTVVGALAGASIASSSRDRDYHKSNDRDYEYYEPEPRRVCHTSYEIEEVEQVEGYHVTYKYLGREFEKVTEEHPGRRLRVYVTVDPVFAQSPAFI